MLEHVHLVDGQLYSNRNWFARCFAWKTDYVTDGKLDGAIIAAEQIVLVLHRLPDTVVCLPAAPV